MIGKVHFRTRCNTSRWDPTLTPRKTVSRRKLNSCDRNAPKAQMGNLSPRNHWFASNCFTLDFPPNLHENSKRVTVASELVSRNDFCHIRVLLLAYLSVRKVVFGFYRSKPSGWASARTSILRLGPGLLRTREDRIQFAQLAASPIRAFSAVLGSECFTLISCRFSTKTQNG